MLKVGGYDSEYLLNSAEVFDCSTQTWQSISNMSISRSNLSVGVLNNNLYAVNLNCLSLFNLLICLTI